MSEEIPVLESYKQLPGEGDAVFQIGDQLVRFTARQNEGDVIGWTVTTASDGYEGFLQNSSDTVWGENGPEPVRTYGYEFRATEATGGPTFQSGSPVDVSVEDFRRIFFGAES
jgi:hypothetical protein